VLRAFPAASERAKVRLARAGVAGVGVIAYLLAVSSESVGALIEQANGFGSGGVFVVVVFGLFTRFGGRTSALATLVAGTVSYFLGLAFEYEYADRAALAAALATYVLAAFVSPQRASA
jgi:Na+/proline symporter